MNPVTAGIQAGTGPSWESSIAGARRGQKLAAIITPPAKPSMESRIFSFIPE
jgi:hypothetical protein